MELSDEELGWEAAAMRRAARSIIASERRYAEILKREKLKSEE